MGMTSGIEVYNNYNAKINNLDSLTICGTGTPIREFLYVDDLARASIQLMNIEKKTFDKQISSMCSHINVGSGEHLTIEELAVLIKDIVGFSGNIKFDSKNLMAQ